MKNSKKGTTGRIEMLHSEHMVFIKIKILLFFLFFQNYSFASLSFRDVKTIDGRDVIYSDLNKVQIEKGQSGPAVAVYNELGAYILFDSKVVHSLSELGQYLILEHERAHHRLGHTLFTKIHRELMLPFNSYYLSQKEKDADCEAGYRLKEDSDYFGDVSREDIRKEMTEIFYAIGGIRETSLPSWLLSRIDVIDVCYKGKLLPRPKPIKNVLDIVGQKIEGLSQKPEKKYHGPNCWNSALYMSDLSHQVRFTSREEFHHIIESPYCERLMQPQKNSIQIYRMSLPFLKGAQTEVHANIWLDQNKSFNKMTAFSTSKYKIESHEKVNEHYEFTLPIQRFSVQDQNGNYQSIRCKKKKCKNLILYYKCQALYEIEADITRPDYQNHYQQILRIEREISEFLFNSQLISENKKVSLLNRLDKQRHELFLMDSATPLQQWQLKFFAVIQHSLHEQLTMRQPRWLSKK